MGAKKLSYSPEVYVAAAQTRMASNKILGVTSSPALINLASGKLDFFSEHQAESIPDPIIVPAEPDEKGRPHGLHAQPHHAGEREGKLTTWLQRVTRRSP